MGVMGEKERMILIPDESKVVYKFKDSKHEKTFDALEWIAAMCSHVPNIGGMIQDATRPTGV